MADILTGELSEVQYAPDSSCPGETISAARITSMLTDADPSSPAVGLGYVALFGVGSMIGMGALSTVIAVPLAVSARWLTWANRGLQGAVGAVTIAIGMMTIVETVFA